ncbi:MAG: hypothetical protein AB9856_00675 [Cellulosilyticaceae bacterium]
MKKTKLLLGSAVLSVALLGTGYAYWTDSLTVNTTVDTAEFSVVMKDAITEKLSSNDTEKDHNGPIDCKTIEVKNNIATLEFNNMYPGAHARYCIEVTNSGTIPAVIDNFTVSTKGNATLIDKMILCGTNITPGAIQTPQNETSYVHGNAIKGALDQAFAGGRLEPGKTMQLMMEVIVDAEVSNGENLEKQNGGLDMQINWKQHNTTK